MAPTFTDAELKEIANRLFLLKTPAPMQLPKPANTGPASFTARFDSIAKDPRFKNMGIGVIDFTEDFGHPKVWLHNGDIPWRIGSTSKLAIMLAAVQLRDDVRQLRDLVAVSEYDELFQMSKLWALYRGKGIAKEGIRQIAGKANAPRITGIFDFTKSPIDFIGPNLDPNDIYSRLPVVGFYNHQEVRELTWEKVGDFDFSELLWLTGAMSSNVAATACASQIGLPYIKAIMRAYGLFDPRHGMYLQLSGPLSNRNLIKDPVLVESSKPDGDRYRPLTHVQRIARVTDHMYDPRTRKYTDQYSWEPGSATALTAYMLALMQNKLVDPSSSTLPPSARGIDGCGTIRSNLAVGIHSIISPLVEGVRDFLPQASIQLEITKVGILGKVDGERSSLICEFAYMETEELRASSQPAKEMKFAVVATGISGLIMEGTQGDATLLSQALGTNVHIALLKP